MSNDIVRSGSCLCGGVQFRVTGEPLRVGLCHCKDCRKTSGSAYQAFAIWPRNAFECEGITSTYGGRSFCPTCGSRLPTVGEDEVEVMIGSLDIAPTEGLEPSYELWIGRREHWLHPLPEARQFEHDRTAGDSATDAGEPENGAGAATEIGLGPDARQGLSPS
ncbi:GFA family protein [Mesorhizobium sp. VK24D]|uniref:GFA family protein n=1 Tax=Mesorhizobium album TaxID=3072314 RepID=A0ABU4Y7G7_9HYPH|nr:GFA family protein [Mesorhizobium sp. VK24D]MDX8482676.1 GFA family protein [Mesorhizobium sp. VK24D]